jgi:hypothetical protein
VVGVVVVVVVVELVVDVKLLKNHTIFTYTLFPFLKIHKLDNCT